MKKNLFIIAIFFFLFIFTDNLSALCVKTSEANLRSGPGSNFKKTWTVYTYMPFRKLSRQGEWYKVKDVDGEIHWIHRSLVTEKHLCAVVKVKKAQIRSGPGKKYDPLSISPVVKYYSFKVIKIGKKRKWMKLQDEVKNRGWMSRELLWVN